MSNADEQDFEMMDDDEDTGREVAVAIRSGFSVGGLPLGGVLDGGWVRGSGSVLFWIN